MLLMSDHCSLVVRCEYGLEVVSLVVLLVVGSRDRGPCWLSILAANHLRDRGGCGAATFLVSVLTAALPVSLSLWCVACFGRASRPLQPFF